MAYSADNLDEGFTFVALDSIPPGATLTFTDRAWNGSQFDRTTDVATGEVKWTAPAEGVPAGTLVSINGLWGVTKTNGIGTVEKSGAYNLGFGDSLSVITGTTEPGQHGTFVTALSVGAPTPLANTGLTAGVDALVFPRNGADAAQFGSGFDVGSIDSATANRAFAHVETARKAYCDPANWVRDGGRNDGAAGDSNNAESSPLGDVNSPLYNKSTLLIDTGLKAGAIAFVAYSGDDADETFTFVLLEDLPAGAAIVFNDRSWNGSSYDMSSGGSITWRVPEGGMKAGETVQINARSGTAAPTATHGTVAKEGVWNLDSGGALYANDGRTGAFLTAVGFSAPYGTNDFLQGTGLTNGVNAIVFPVDFQSYFFRDSGDVGSINSATANTAFSSLDAARAAYNTVSNWVRDGGANDGLPTDTNDPESQALFDPNSPLYGKWKLPVICFLAGTLIRTPTGEVPVEALSIGDPVLTHEGRAVPVKWIGRQTVSRIFADPVRVLPIRIRAGALGDAVPSRDLFVSPDHALLVDGVLVQAGALVNGTSIARFSQVPTTFTYYHVELDDHALIVAENTPAETFVDSVERMAFDNWDEHEALYPEAPPIAEMPYPRAKAARQVPRATRARIALRAGTVGAKVLAGAA